MSRKQLYVCIPPEPAGPSDTFTGQSETSQAPNIALLDARLLLNGLLFAEQFQSSGKCDFSQYSTEVTETIIRLSTCVNMQSALCYIKQTNILVEVLVRMKVKIITNGQFSVAKGKVLGWLFWFFRNLRKFHEEDSI